MRGGRGLGYVEGWEWGERKESRGERREGSKERRGGKVEGSGAGAGRYVAEP